MDANRMAFMQRHMPYIFIYKHIRDLFEAFQKTIHICVDIYKDELLACTVEPGKKFSSKVAETINKHVRNFGKFSHYINFVHKALYLLIDSNAIPEIRPIYIPAPVKKI